MSGASEEFASDSETDALGSQEYLRNDPWKVYWIELGVGFV